MSGQIPKLIAILLSGILISITLTGFFKDTPKSTEGISAQPDVQIDFESKLPDWNEGEYHDYQETKELLDYFNQRYPDLVDVFSIGDSVLGNDIWCIRITNEKSSEVKSSCLIDGCIHGDEWESADACLYLSEYLLINYGYNQTISDILNSSKIYIIPILNPDGRISNTRWNENGVDLNRNFDIYFGKLRSRNLRIGKLFGIIKIPYVRFFSRDPSKYFWNCGRIAFSEPETRALRKFMNELDNYGDFSFYINCHTALHTVIAPWLTYKPPFEMSLKETNLFEYTIDWINTNTEYEGIKGENGNYGGLAMDWCFKNYRVPSFLFNMLSLDYDPWLGEGKHDNLVHWMKTTIPVFMYFLMNINNFRQWETPVIKPLLPEEISTIHFI